MRTVNTIRIDCELPRLFELAADVERWPRVLPHYRWVKTIRRDGDTALVEMAARRDAIPVKWVSVQHISRSEGRIHYKHVAGPTAGMWVEWRFEQAHDGVEVTIFHDLTLKWPVVSWPLGKLVVGEFFVKCIADRTLKCMRSHIEEGRRGR